MTYDLMKACQQRMVAQIQAAEDTKIFQILDTICRLTTVSVFDWKYHGDSYTFRLGYDTEDQQLRLSLEKPLQAAMGDLVVTYDGDKFIFNNGIPSHLSTIYDKTRWSVARILSDHIHAHELFKDGDPDFWQFLLSEMEKCYPVIFVHEE